MKSKIVLIIVFAVFILISGIIYMNVLTKESEIYYKFEKVNESIDDDIIENEVISENIQSDKSITESGLEEFATTSSSQVVVYLHGAIISQGVYKLKPGARVYEALELAGGMQENASSGHVNLARVLIDGESVYFPTKDEVILISEQEEVIKDDRVNINKATMEELITLPGIGDTKARSIIAYRTLNGDFSKTEEIMKVSGIKESLFDTISVLIRIK